MTKRSWLTRTGATGALAVAALTAPAPSSADPQAPAAPISRQPEAAAASKFFSTLYKRTDAPDAKPYLWMDQDGNEINLKALETAKIRGKQATLTFGFNGCPVFCKTINDRLKAIDAMNPQMVHVVVSVNPDVDATPNGRKQFLEELQRNIGLKEKDKDRLIILFPIKKDSEGKAVRNKDGGMMFDATMASEVQIRNLGAQINAKNPKAHTPNIYLFGDNGELLGQKPGTRPVGEFQKDWQQQMPEPKKGKDR
ncbi:MAG: SCO family protein [Alphaproteobacteria bacterium]|nr:SCO family protein [Alphaproteobacteria bacterium]